MLPDLAEAQNAHSNYDADDLMDTSDLELLSERPHHRLRHQTFLVSEWRQPISTFASESQ